MGGHDLLLKYMRKYKKEYLYSKILVEIGSTREFFRNQNSSEAFIKFCREMDMVFISIDMDPECTKNVENIAKKHKFTNFTAITMKGEDFLKYFDGIIDFIYLDGFDYNHHYHSEARREKYRKYLNCEIDNELAHKMHLECAQNLVDKISDNSTIVFNNIIDKEAKTGKGAHAIPYLLFNGFRVIDFEHGAMALRRIPEGEELV